MEPVRSVSFLVVGTVVTTCVPVPMRRRLHGRCAVYADSWAAWRTAAAGCGGRGLAWLVPPAVSVPWFAGRLPGSAA